MPNTCKTVFVPMPRDHDHVSLRETLLDAVPTIKAIHFAPGNLFAVFATPQLADEAVRTINESLRIHAQIARMELAREAAGGNNAQQYSHTDQHHQQQRRPSNQPGPELVLAAPKFLEKEDLERLLEIYPGFESLDGRRATFSDALWAYKAYDDLNTSTNIIAHFGKLPDKLDPPPDIDVNAASAAGSSAARRGYNGGTIISISRIPKGSTISLARDLLGMLARYKGFIRIAFQSETQCFADFCDAASAQAAIARLRATTSMSADIAQKRPTDPTQFPLEQPCASLFVRLEPFLCEPEARALFESMTGCEELVFAAQHAIVHFASRRDAGRALEYIRRSTNLVVNFSKNIKRSGASATAAALAAAQLAEADPNSPHGVMVHAPPYGANVKELFSIYDGFKGLICDEDGAAIGVYHNLGAAKRAHAEIQRSLSSPTTLICRNFAPRQPSGHVSPSSVLYVSLSTALTEGQVRRLLSAYRGFGNFTAVTKLSGERYGLAQFDSIQSAEDAMWNLCATTNLNVDYSKKGDSAFVYSAGDGRPRRETAYGPMVQTGLSGELFGGEKGGMVSPRSMEQDELDFEQFAGSKRNSTILPSTFDPSNHHQQLYKAHSGSAGARNVLHLTSPPPSISSLKTFVISNLGATRLVLKRGYCFIAFDNPTAASRAVPKLAERFPACEVQFARTDVRGDVRAQVEEKSKTTTTTRAVRMEMGWGGVDAIAALADLARSHDGFRDFEPIAAVPGAAVARFTGVEKASALLKDLNAFTNVRCSYAAAGPDEGDERAEQSSAVKAAVSRGGRGTRGRRGSRSGVSGAANGPAGTNNNRAAGNDETRGAPASRNPRRGSNTAKAEDLGSANVTSKPSDGPAAAVPERKGSSSNNGGGRRRNDKTMSGGVAVPSVGAPGDGNQRQRRRNAVTPPGPALDEASTHELETFHPQQHLSASFSSIERARENVARTANFTRSGANAFMTNHYNNDSTEELSRRVHRDDVNGLNLRHVYGGGVRKRYSGPGSGPSQPYRPRHYPRSWSLAHINNGLHVRTGLRGHLDKELVDYTRLRRKNRVNLSESAAAELRVSLNEEIDEYMLQRKELDKQKQRQQQAQASNKVATANDANLASPDVHDADADTDGISETKRRDISAELEAYLADDGTANIIDTEIMETEVTELEWS
ncbi:hypothetical protein HDU86_007353 [Geranomyces michiganensis]|nr:hypothetical protein HDU86_007353 [Geranomyces michiganensis]